jgi:hypothetical protein
MVSVGAEIGDMQAKPYLSGIPDGPIRPTGVRMEA